MKIRSLIISHITDSASSRPDIELVTGLHKQGVEVDVMIPAHSGCIGLFTKMGIRVIPFHPVKKFSSKTIRLIRSEIRRRNYHILHLFNTRAIVNGCIAAIGQSVKVIAYRGAAGVYWYDPTAWWSHLNPRIDMLICNSRYVQQHVRRQLFFNRQKAVMVHKGMDIAWFEGINPVSRASIGIPEDAILLGCVANVRKVKGVPYLLEAMHHIDPALPIHLLLIGSGMDSVQNLRLIESGPFKDRIHILGFRKDVYELIAACDIYLQPSLSESLSRSVMEAMCLGIPCIVSNTGGLLELVKHNKSGLVVKKGDSRTIAGAIEQLANDAGQRKLFATEGTLRIKQLFSVDNMVCNTLNYYHKLLN